MPDRSLVPGASVWIRDRQWRVDRIRRSRAVVALDVSRDGEHRTFLTPFDRAAPAARRRATRVRRQQAVARLAGLAGLAAHLPSARSLDSGVDARVTLLAYQLEPALALVAGGAGRVLIADEVGLGKTIQAAYGVAEIVRREPHARVLVLTPASLIDQWHGELSTRFGLDAIAIDRAALDEASARLAPGDTPWRSPGVRLASLDFLKQPHVFDALPAIGWDLLVIDEAHTACGDSDRHERCRRLAASARRVVLLTATPHDGDPIRFHRLLALGAIDASDDPLVVFRRTRADAGLATSRRTRRHHVALSPAERHALDALDRFGRLAGTNAGGLDLLMTVLRKRAMSTMQALARSLERRRAWLEASGAANSERWRQTPLPFGDEDEGDDAEWRAITGHSGLDPHREQEWLTRLESLAASASQRDAKIARVVALLRRTNESAIVFTEYRDSLEALRARLSRSLPLAILHGGQTVTERRAELRRFLHGEARVLAATDVAGVGLNLHTRARWVITLDLPWNPMRLDQRIGRVDRIGQTRGVHHTVLIARHPHDAHVRRHLEQRAATAEEALRPGPASQADRDDVHPRLPAPCDAYRRPARWMVRSLERRRRLAARWRGAVSVRSLMHARSRRGVGRCREAALVWIAPVVDGAGREIDARLVICRVDAAALGEAFDRMVAEAQRRVERLAERRAARLARWLAATGGGHPRDAAIAQSLLSSRPAAVDVGLFDQREWRGHAAARDLAQRDASDERRRRRAQGLASQCKAGSVQLVCVVEGPR